MASNLFKRYIWLADTIHRYGPITLAEIRTRWQRSALYDGRPLARRTFHSHRDAVEELFDLSIVCDEHTNRYSIANSEDLIDMNAMAKLAADENFNIGRTRLFRWLKRTGVLMSNNLPYQRYIDRGYFAVKESVFEVNGLKKTYRQTFVTGKGQLFIIGLLRKYYGKEMS